jgi:hypothetical protein
MARLRNVWRNLKSLLSFNFALLPGQHEKQLLVVGKSLTLGIRSISPKNLHDVEFSIFSQWGDDGIIQYLINFVPISNCTFVEFGVEDYRESNTRFLLMNNNWKGLIIDGSGSNMERVRKSNLYWKHDLTAVGRFVNRENINSIFMDHGFIGSIGLLSIDIDGNDYWIWEAITVIDPDIVIVEYNSVFGNDHAITVPYNPTFDRTKAHYSNLYWGSSLKGLIYLSEKKGYAFVGCNSNGNNAYFVKKQKVGKLNIISAEEGFVNSLTRESLDQNGKMDFCSGTDRINKIMDMEVVDVQKNQTFKIRDLK